MTCCTRAGRRAPRSTSWPTSADPRASGCACWSIAAVASCRSSRTSSGGRSSTPADQMVEVLVPELDGRLAVEVVNRPMEDD
jgi:hypothetical protein